MKFLVWTLLTFSMQTYAADTKFFVEGMTCPMCASSVEKAFKAIDGFKVESVKIVSMATGEVIVTTKGDMQLPKQVILNKLKETNFTLKKID